MATASEVVILPIFPLFYCKGVGVIDNIVRELSSADINIYTSYAIVCYVGYISQTSLVGQILSGWYVDPIKYVI